MRKLLSENNSASGTLNPKRQHRNTQSSCEPSYQLHRRQDTLIDASDSCGLLSFFLEEG